MKHYTNSIIIAVLLLAVSFCWGFFHGPAAGLNAALTCLGVAAILAVVEVSLSFDNAIVNASVLKGWDPFWQKMFLTVGILIAVFGMRLVFPIVIVAFTADMSLAGVVNLALDNPAEYAVQLTKHHAEISAFGGAFLALVGLSFFLDKEKDSHWFNFLESKLALVGSPLAPIFVVLVAILAIASTPETIIAGLAGIAVYTGVDILCNLLEGDDEEDSSGNVKSTVVKAGLGGFIYLEVLDASFSFDGVVGAFAITQDLVIIMTGLAIGAFFVRSITIHLVKTDTLSTFRYLEHGAMYAIVALSAVMLYGMTGKHLPELFVGSVSVAFILAAFAASIWANKKDALNTSS